MLLAFRVNGPATQNAKLGFVYYTIHPFSCEYMPIGVCLRVCAYVFLCVCVTVTNGSSLQSICKVAAALCG